MPPTLAETMMNAAIDSTDPAKAPDFAGHFAQGAQLAQHAEQLRQSADEIQQKKEMLELTKNDKVIQWMTTDLAKVPKKAQGFYLKSQQNKAGQMGMKVSDEFINALQSPDVNQGALSAAAVDFRTNYRGALTEPDPKKKAAFLDAAKQSASVMQAAFDGDVTKFGPYLNTALDNESTSYAQTVRTDMTTKAADKRQTKEINSAGAVEVAKKTGEEFVKYGAVGGSAGYDRADAALSKAIDALKTGKVNTGDWPQKLPYGKDPAVLATINPKLKALMDDVYSTQNIKALSGDPNPGEKQISEIRSLGIDPRLSNDANIAKLEQQRTLSRTDRQNKEAAFRASGHLPPASQAAKTYNIGGVERTADEAKAFYSAHPNFLTPKLKKALGL